METLRAFIAIEMPGLVADAVRRSQQALRQDGIRLRWVRPENVHLTLRFLGDIPTEIIPVIREAMERSVFRRQSVSLRISGMGAFPGMTHPKVVWLGLKGQVDLLDDLHRNLSMFLAEQGIPSEKRPFKGHLTIGRVKDRLDSESLRTVLSRLTPFETDTFVTDSLALFKSELTPRGSVYTPLVQVKMDDVK